MTRICVGNPFYIACCKTCDNVVIISDIVVHVNPKVLEVICTSDYSSFHFDNLCFIVLDVLFVITWLSLFLTMFFMEDQSGVSGVSVLYSAGVE